MMTQEQIDDLPVDDKMTLLATLAMALGEKAVRVVLDRIGRPGDAEHPFHTGTAPQASDVPIMVPDDRFASKGISDAGAVKMAVLRGSFTLNGRTVEECCKPGRYRALALTALEEACMWSIKSLTHEPDGAPR